MRYVAVISEGLPRLGAAKVAAMATRNKRMARKKVIGNGRSIVEAVTGRSVP